MFGFPKGIQSTAVVQEHGNTLDEHSITACIEGNKEALERLLTADDQLGKKRDDKERTLLHYAVLNAHQAIEKGKDERLTKLTVYLAIMDTLLDNGADINAQDNCGNTALHHMCERGKMTVVKNLLLKGADVSVVNNEQCTPLHLAAAVHLTGNQWVVVKLCLKHGAAVDARQEDNATALHLACTQGALKIVQILVKSHMEKFPTDGKKILDARDSLDMTPLHKAAMYDHSEVVQYLIEMGSKLDLGDSEYRTPMLVAAICAESKSLEILLEAGADVTSKDWNEQNLLHYMASLGQPLSERLQTECLKREHRGSSGIVSKRDVNGCTALHLAARAGNLQCAKDLIGLGSVLNAKDNKEQTPLHYAAESGQLDTLRLLVSVHGNSAANERDSNGLTALHVASSKGHLKLVRELLLKGALMHRDAFGFTPMHMASQAGHVDIIKLLLSFRYCFDKMDQTCNEGNTSLHIAAFHDQADSVELLLNAGATYCENNSGETPLDICCSKQHVQAATVLVKHDRRDEVLKAGSNMYINPTYGLIRCLPEVYAILLDTCHITGDTDTIHEYYFVYLLHDQLGLI